MKFVSSTLIAILFSGLIQRGSAFDFSWEIDETPERAESATMAKILLINRKTTCFYERRS